MAVTIRKSPAITPIRENSTDSIRFFASKSATQEGETQYKTHDSACHIHFSTPTSAFTFPIEHYHCLSSWVVSANS